MKSETTAYWYAGLTRGGRKAWLAGPFATRELAESVLALAHREAEAVDPFCHFDAPTVIKLERPAEKEKPPPGVLNSKIAIAILR